jgi:hypothetical protein
MRYTVWYFRPEVADDALMGRLEVDMTHLPRTHEEVGYVDKETKEEVFAFLNGEAWEDAAPIYFRQKIKTPLSHTSMSVGDVLVDRDGATWLVEPIGWKRLGPVD